MKIFNLSNKFLFSRKKWLFLMIVSVSLVIAAVTSILTASEAIKGSMREEAYQKYGEHTGLLTGINESKESVQKKVEKTGEYHLFNTLKISGNKFATVGWMDRDAITLGHLDLLRGKFPSKLNEVAIESAYLKLIDPSWKVGQTRKLQLENKSTTVVLVGIIKNYSYQWSGPIAIEKGINDLPNIFVYQNQVKSSTPNNFLVKLHASKNTAQQKLNKIFGDDINHVVFNSRLYNNGLIDYNTVNVLSTIFECLTLLLSLLCLVSLISYFNLKQNQKNAILKSFGYNNLTLYKLYTLQCVTILLFSIIIAIPLVYILYHLIIYKSFHEGLVDNNNTIYILSLLFAWLIIILFVLIYISTNPLRKAKHSSINGLLKKENQSTNIYDWLTTKLHIRSFSNKQLIRQLFLYPKQTLLTIIILTFSILLLIFSVFINKEFAGLSNSQEAYYIDSQEIYGSQNINNLEVLNHPGLTFSKDDIRSIEELPGVAYVDKSPFMTDVFPLIYPNDITLSIRHWLENNQYINKTYEEKAIIPETKYKIIDKKIFNASYPNANYKDFIGKVIIYIPNPIQNSNDKSLIGKQIDFIKMYRQKENTKTIEKSFKIYDIKNKPLIKKINNQPVVISDDITILMDQQTATKSGFFHGYNEIGVYLNKQITNKQRLNIDEKLNQLVATFPGSLFQNIPEFYKEDNKIYSFIGILGNLSFTVASILSVISILIIVFSKYQIEKRTWGIYLSQGMSKKQVIKFLYVESVSYTVIASLISFITFSLISLSFSQNYSYFCYIEIFATAIAFILTLTIIGNIVLNKIVNKQTVSSLLREIE